MAQPQLTDYLTQRLQLRTDMDEGQLHNIESDAALKNEARA